MHTSKNLFVPAPKSSGVSFPFQELIAPRVAAISQNLEKDLHYFQSTMFTVFLPGAKVLDKGEEEEEMEMGCSSASSGGLGFSKSGTAAV